MKGFIIKNLFHKKIFANLCWIPHILIEFLSLTNSQSDFSKIIKDGGFYKTFKNFFAAIQYCKLATNLPLFNRFFVGLRKPPLLLVFFSKIRAKMHFHSSKMCIFFCVANSKWSSVISFAKVLSVTWLLSKKCILNSSHMNLPWLPYLAKCT